MLLLQRHLSALHHSTKWSHIEHWVTHELLAWSTRSLHLWLNELLLERHLPIFSGLRHPILAHALVHLCELRDLLLLHKHADLSVGRLVKLPKLGNLATVSQLHDVFLHGQLWGFFTTLVVLDQILQLFQKEKQDKWLISLRKKKSIANLGKVLLKGCLPSYQSCQYRFAGS